MSNHLGDGTRAHYAVSVSGQRILLRSRPRFPLLKIRPSREKRRGPDDDCLRKWGAGSLDLLSGQHRGRGLERRELQLSLEKPRRRSPVHQAKFDLEELELGFDPRGFRQLQGVRRSEPIDNLARARDLRAGFDPLTLLRASDGKGRPASGRSSWPKTRQRGQTSWPVPAMGRFALSSLMTSTSGPRTLCRETRSRAASFLLSSWGGDAGLPEVWITLSGASGGTGSFLRRSSHRRGEDSPGVRPDSPVGAHSCWCSNRIASRERRCGAWIGHASTSALTRSEVDPGSIVIATGCEKTSLAAIRRTCRHLMPGCGDAIEAGTAPRLATPSRRLALTLPHQPLLSRERLLLSGAGGHAENQGGEEHEPGRESPHRSTLLPAMAKSNSCQEVIVSRSRLKNHTSPQGCEKQTCYLSASVTNSNSAFVAGSSGRPISALILLWFDSRAPKTLTGTPASFSTFASRWACAWCRDGRRHA